MNRIGSHDPLLVALSLLIAILASYTALDLASRIRASAGWASRIWLGAAAVAMGGGIWAMHFVAMLAFTLPGVGISYDLPLTLLSLGLPIAVTGIGFAAASRANRRRQGLAAGGLIMGLGIAAMHYTGMAAMRVPAAVTYDAGWVAASVAIAIAAAMAALWLAMQESGMLRRAAAALLMGAAISGMHFSAMHGARFAVDVDPLHPTSAGVGQTDLALWITAIALLILTFAMTASLVDRAFAARARREADALRESEERFRLLVQSVKDYAIFMLDADGRVANWNPGAQRFKGYEAAEIVGSHFSRFYTDEDRANGLPARALATARTEGKFEDEGWRVRRDGTRFWAHVVIDPIIGGSGEVIGFAKVTRDVTERKRAQKALDEAREALFQSQKMEALGQLTGGIAHDFNNLLMAVLASLELLKKRLPPDPRLTRLVANAVAGAERGAALTQRLLAFSRRQDLAPAPVDVRDIVHGMADLLQRSTGPAITLQTQFPLSLPKVLVDANQLELALLNLCVNARDAMPDGGTITIEGRTIEAEGEDGARVALCVVDTGVGMDEATASKALDPFFTTKGVGKGTGLGLPMVKGLAEQSNGRFVLSSRPGEGTRAEIHLPLWEGGETRVEARAPDDETEAAEAARPALTVLVVDDDPLVLENAVAMLEDLGHVALQARDGREALERVRSEGSLDLVLTDHAMPGMTGMDLARTLSAERPQLPVVLASGFAELSGEEKAGVVRLSKPYDQAGLRRAITAALPVAAEPGSVVSFRPQTKAG